MITKVLLTIILVTNLTPFPIRGRAMSSERAAMHTQELQTNVVIEVNYTLGTSKIYSEGISFEFIPPSHPYRSLVSSVPSSVPRGPSAGLGIPTSSSRASVHGLGLAPGIPPRGAMGSLVHVVSADSYSLEKLDANLDLASYSGVKHHDACGTVLNPGKKPWIALVEDASRCDRSVQLNHIFSASIPAEAAIIYGREDREWRMESAKGIVIDNPKKSDHLAVLVVWHHMKKVVTYCFNSTGSHGSRLCNASIHLSSAPHDNFLNKTSVLFVSISFILLMIISLAWLVFYYVQRFRYIHTKEQISRRLAHLAKKAVARIPIKTLKQGDKETDCDCDQCAICIEPYKPAENIRILPCRHYFHKNCIDPWLLEQRSCPMCKLDILRAFGLQAMGERGSLISEDHLSEIDSGTDALGGTSTPNDDINPYETYVPSNRRSRRHSSNSSVAAATTLNEANQSQDSIELTAMNNAVASAGSVAAPAVVAGGAPTSKPMLVVVLKKPVDAARRKSSLTVQTLTEEEEEDGDESLVRHPLLRSEPNTLNRDGSFEIISADAARIQLESSPCIATA